MGILSRILLALVLGGCYALTIAPDLTWQHFSADSGDLITAAAVWGVPHPTGYPLYLILAKAFQFIPVGSPAFRVNLLSAVCSILAALVVYEFVNEQLRTNPFRHQLALLGALAYGLAPAVWAQALVTEVYATHGLLVAASLYVFVKPGCPEWTRGLVFGLAASHHVTSILLFPLLLLYTDKKGIALRFAGVFSGLLFYLTLPLRALANPPVNWGDASTLQGFLWLVRGAMYSKYALVFSFPDLINRLRAAAGLALEQFTAPGLILAFYGLFLLRPSAFLFSTLWAVLATSFFTLTYATGDSLVYLIVLWLCFAIWLAVGAGNLLGELEKRAPRAARFSAFALIALLLLRLPSLLPLVDVSDDRQAIEFLERALDELPANAMAFVSGGDGEFFSLWYGQFVLEERKDIVIISDGLLQFQWYNRSLEETYPSFVVPRQEKVRLFDLVVANPDRRLCYVSLNAIDCR